MVVLYHLNANDNGYIVLFVTVFYAWMKKCRAVKNEMQISQSNKIDLNKGIKYLIFHDSLSLA